MATRKSEESQQKPEPKVVSDTIDKEGVRRITASDGVTTEWVKGKHGIWTPRKRPPRDS